MVFVTLLLTMMMFSFNQATSPPGRPQRVSVVSDVNNIGVQWEPPAETYGNIRRYIVSWAILPNFTDVTNIVDGDVTMSIISTRDHAGRLFRIRIRAENDGGIGPYSTSKYVRIKCGRDYSVFPGHNITVTSPDVKQGAPLQPGVLCLWKITTVAKYSLEITFDEIDMTKNFSEECSSEFIEISGIGRLCNNKTISKHVRTHLQTVNITLKTARHVGIRGFRITFRSLVLLPGPPTNIKVRTSDRAILITWQSPRENTLDITSYRISYRVVPHDSRILVTVGHAMRHFAINTNSFEGKLIELQLSAAIGFEEGQMSENIFTRAPCRRHITLSDSDSVNITSPGYPRAYPSNIICTWYITLASNVTSPITITYLDFKLEDTSFCSNDYVMFSLRENTEHECSNMKTPRIIRTNAQNFTVTLVTDGQKEFSGFCIGIKTEAIFTEKERLATEQLTTKTELMTSTVRNAYTSMNMLTSFKNSFTSPKNYRTSSKVDQLTTETNDLSTTRKSLKQYFAKRNYSKQLTEISNDTTTKVTSTHAYRFSAEHTAEVTTYARETVVYNMLLENDSYMSSAEPLMLHFAGKGSSSNERDTTEIFQDSKDDNNNNAVLVVLLSTISCIVVLLLSTCFLRWRRRVRNMKVDAQPMERYRSTSIEMYDILRKPSHSGGIRSNCRTTVTDVDIETSPARRHLETIHEEPEEYIKKENDNKHTRKRCHSFPFCLSLRRRKIHQEIKRKLKSFSFIDDQQALQNALMRKARLQRTNSL